MSNDLNNDINSVAAWIVKFLIKRGESNLRITRWAHTTYMGLLLQIRY